MHEILKKYSWYDITTYTFQWCVETFVLPQLIALRPGCKDRFASNMWYLGWLANVTIITAFAVGQAAHGTEILRLTH